MGENPAEPKKIGEYLMKIPAVILNTSFFLKILSPKTGAKVVKNPILMPCQHQINAKLKFINTKSLLVTRIIINFAHGNWDIHTQYLQASNIYSHLRAFPQFARRWLCFFGG